MATRQQNAREFVKTWSSPNKGREDADRQTFWNDLLQRVYGIDDYYNYITYEKDVPVKVDGKVTTRRIDGYIPSTKVLIEMKGKNVKDLAKTLQQSGGGRNLTPFEQAKRYANFLPNSEQPRWILVSNFNEIDIHDMEHPLDAPKVIKLEDLPKNVKALEFVVDASQQQVIDEKQLSVDAGNLVAKIYNELVVAYSKGRGIDIDNPQIQKSLNMLIVRLVFLLYADDSNLFGEEDIFQKFMENSRPEDLRQRLIELFKVLDQQEDKRDPFLNSEYNQFPYINGGMFSEENIIIPQFTDELKRLIVEDAGQGFDWSGISPTIFGAVFESTLNPETRRSGGMHYTSIENIHKVIDPLFLNDLHEKFDKIQNMGNRNQRVIKAREFRQKIGKLKFLDPACGSGNFLTETYLSLRKMENECLRIIIGDQGALAITGESDPQVKIQNFYGIEINDFAVSVARTAMWIAESQMWEQTKDITFANKDFLPLDSNDSIYEGNALRMNWNDIVKPYELNYIMGNPPFIGYSLQNKEQKQDLENVFVDADGNRDKYAGKIDYVAGWYYKAAQYIKKTTVSVALVSTNSITQGEQVPFIWEPLYKLFNIHIDFAHHSFVWTNEAKKNAAVVCVIIGFSSHNTIDKTYPIFENNRVTNVKQINPYLINGPIVFVKNRTNPICDVPKIVNGSKPVDGGYFFLSEKEKNAIIRKYPNTRKMIKQFYGASEFIKGKHRYCLWLNNVNPNEYRKIDFIKKRIEKVKCFREQSKKRVTRESAKVPMLFQQIRQPNSNYLVIPRHTTSEREYIPVGFMSPTDIAGDAVLVVPNTSLFEFGIITSSVHMSWVKVVAGRLGNGYRYSAKIVYNNFPWPDINDKQKKKILETAQTILNVRKLYPESSLADLYDPLTMPIELRKAHEANDKAVLKAYGLKPSETEQEIIQYLFEMYEQLIRE